MAITPLEAMEKLAGVRVSFKWLGLVRSFTESEKQEVAGAMGADPRLLSLSKYLIDSKNPYLKRLNQLKGRLDKYWKQETLAWVEPGIRLLLREEIPAFKEEVERFQGEILEASMDFGAHYQEVLEESRQKLKELYHRSDFPENGYGLFEATLGFPNLMPPSYLDPTLYEKEMQARAREFEQALARAEESFGEQFAGMVEYLAENLKPSADGTPKKFYDGPLTRLQEFFERFRKLNFRDSPQLRALVEQAEQLVGDTDPAVMRVDKKLRVRVQEGLEEIRTALPSVVVVKKRRVVERAEKAQPEAAEASAEAGGVAA